MHRAFEEGQRRYSWWPDWRGEVAVIVASGESTRQARVELTRDRVHVLAVKANIDLVPWADAVYGCDEMWWNMREGLPKYRGLKFTYAATVPPRYPDVKKVEIDPRDLILVDEPLKLGSGGNSGFQAVNLVIQWGVTDIALVGFDMRGSHWYGRNKPPMNNPDQSNFDRWLKGFATAAPILKQMGVTVVNCSPSSSIKCFPKATLEDTLNKWGL